MLYTKLVFLFFIVLAIVAQSSGSESKSASKTDDSGSKTDDPKASETKTDDKSKATDIKDKQTDSKSDDKDSTKTKDDKASETSDKSGSDKSSKSDSSKSSSDPKATDKPSARAMITIMEPRYNDDVKGSSVPLKKNIKFKWIFSNTPYENPKKLNISLVQKRAGGNAKYDIATIPGTDKEFEWKVKDYVPEDNENGIFLKAGSENMVQIFIHDSETKYDTLNPGKKIRPGPRNLVFYQPMDLDNTFTDNANLAVPSLALLALSSLVLL